MSSTNNKNENKNENKKEKINYRRFVSALVYLILGIITLILVGYKSKLYIEVNEVCLNLPRYFWCLGWSCLGFSGIAFYWCRSNKTPFPIYATSYPILLAIISALVFSVCHLFEETSGFVFYYLSAGLSGFFAYFVDYIPKVFNVIAGHIKSKG